MTIPVIIFSLATTEVKKKVGFPTYLPGKSFFGYKRILSLIITVIQAESIERFIPGEIFQNC